MSISKLYFEDELKKINSDETKPLDTLIDEKTAEIKNSVSSSQSSIISSVTNFNNALKPSVTGVGATIFDYTKGIRTSSRAYEVVAKFVAPKSGVYIHNITLENDGGGSSGFYLTKNANVYFNINLAESTSEEYNEVYFLGDCNKGESAILYFNVSLGETISILGKSNVTSAYNGLSQNKITYQP